MKPSDHFSKVLCWVAILLLTLGTAVTAQDIEEEMNMTCEPENLQSPYDQFASDEISPNQLSIWYDYGREYYKKAGYGKTAGEKTDASQENYRQAIPYFWRIIVNDRQHIFKIAYGKIIDCYLNIAQPDSALFTAYRGLSEYPDYPTLHYHAGYLEQSRGMPECAIPHYEALVAIPDQVPARLKDYYAVLAQLYLQTEDDRCIAAQEKVMALDPDNVEAAATLVRMMDFFGLDPIKARLSAFEKDTSNVLYARQYGISAYEAGQYTESKRAFQAVLIQDAKNVEAMSYIGRSYEGLNMLTPAIKTYKTIIGIDPDRLNTLCALASVYTRLNEFSVARSYARRALNKDGNFGLAYMVLGEIYENAVSQCANQRDKEGYSYDDKLVFELARTQYARAAAKDRNVASSAKSRYNQLAPFVRSKADKHMHANRTNIKDKCYNWIKPNS